MAKAFRINTGPICGAVTSTGATIKAAVVRDTSQAAVIFDTSPDFTAPRRVAASGSWVDPEKEYEDRILTFQLSGLTPATSYHFQLELNGVVHDERPGGFKTFPARDSHTSFRFACASCSGNRN
jgi:hypothetical protein